MPPTKGTLILAANCLGNPEDIPTRALEWVEKATLLIFEEDRPARQILKKAKVFRDYLRHNEHGQKETLLAAEETLLKGGSVLYMSDQGASGMDDPGADLVALAFRIKANINIIPGPSSLTGAISASPLPLKKFLYLGFLPREPKLRHEELKKSLALKIPLIILDTPYRLKALITQIAEMHRDFRHFLLAKEIGNENETYFFYSTKELKNLLPNCDKKDNFVLILFP